MTLPLVSETVPEIAPPATWAWTFTDDETTKASTKARRLAPNVLFEWQTMEASFCAGWCGEAYLNQNKSKHINFRSSKISLAVHSRQVDYEQHHDQRKDGSEAQIKFRADRHAILPLSAAALLGRGTNRNFRLVLRLKLEFHNSAAFCRGGFESPLLDRVHSRIHQDRVPAYCLRTLHCAVRRHHHGQLHGARDAHAACNLGICRRDLGLNFTRQLLHLRFFPLSHRRRRTNDRRSSRDHTKSQDPIYCPLPYRR